MKSTISNNGKEPLSFNMPDQQSFNAAAFQSNIGILSSADQQALHEARVAIPGMGGVGGTHLISLVRAGVGNFKLADFDRFEPKNINRQYGAKVDSFGRPKLEVMIEEARAINPYLHITPYHEGVTKDNLNDFLDGCQVVLDSIEFFAFDIRRSLYQEARKRNIPVIIAAPLGFSSCMLVFHPEKSPTFDEYFDIHPGLSEVEKLLKFGLGLAPRPTFLSYMDFSSIDLGGGRGPSSGIACYLCSAMAAMEAVRIILKRPGLRPVPAYTIFDPYKTKLRRGRMPGGNRNPWQKIKFVILKKRLGIG